MNAPEGFYRLKADSISLRVKAKPGATRDAVLGVRGDELLVSVRAVAEGGKANREIIRILSDALTLRKDQVVLRLGTGAPHKVFELPVSCLSALKRLGDAP